MNLPTYHADAFEMIDDCMCVVVTKKGTRYPLPLFSFDGSVYFQWQGGYVRITTPSPFRSDKDRVAFNTEHPDLWVSHVVGDNVHTVRRNNGAAYLRLKTGDS